MRPINRGLLMCAVCIFLTGMPGAAFAQNASDDTTQEVISLLKEQNSKLSGDLRRIQREIAGLRADLGQPGISDVFSGVGYIFGLFGTAAFVAARRRKE